MKATSTNDFYMGFKSEAHDNKENVKDEIEKVSPKPKEVLYDFTQETTLHGIKYITAPSIYIIRRYVTVFHSILINNIFAKTKWNCK